MAGALVSIVEEQVNSIIKEEFKLIVSVDDELKNISTTLVAIWAGLKDAEERQVREERVKFCLEELRDVSYSIHDLLDEWSTRTLMSQNELVDNSALACSKEDKEIIIRKLLSESSLQNESHPVISIVGMWGLGKTTLTQTVFNDDRVKSHFNKKMWVSVSQPFDETKVAKATIKTSTGKELPDEQSWEALHQYMYECVKEKRFLLVLDDKWTTEYQDWEPFEIFLKDGARGSRIMVTTRNKDVANMMASKYIYDLKLFSKEDLWSLFGGMALFWRSDEECRGLHEIGRKIVSKCKGLSLAAKALEGLLRLKKSKRDWETVLESETWKWKGVIQGIIPALWLSYYDLPSHLKYFFEYCAIFPKGSTIYKEELIWLWMAQGFLTSRGEEEMERVGGEYFDDLVTGSLLHAVQVDENGFTSKCNMHDMVHDLVQFITKKECLTIDQDARNKVAEFGCSAKIRHLTPLCNNIDDVLVPSIHQVVNLRTLKFKRSYVYHFTPFLSISLCNLTCLRSLDLSTFKIQELPHYKKLIF